MGILQNLGLRAKPLEVDSQRISAQYAPAVMDAPFGTYYGNFGGYNNYVTSIDRQNAMSVPAIARCRNLIAGTIASIPLETYSTKDGKELPNLVWIDQPDKRQPRSVTIAWTVDSLLHYGVSYWRVEEIYQDDNRPARYQWIQNDRISVKLNKTSSEVEYYMIDGTRAPMDGVGSLITFQALDQGILIRGQRTIQSAIDIEKAINIASQTPQPSGFIKNSGADLPDAQVQGLLATWKAARQNRATAYLTSTLDYVPTSFSPKDMTYNDSAQFLCTQLARICNVPAYMISADMNNSMTYQNILDARKEFLAYSLQPFITAIEDRLSMDDLTPRGQVVRFSVDETFLRADAMARLNVTEKLLNLNLISLDEARSMEDLAPMGEMTTNDINVQ
jgi:HK97 family phage portal protein